MEDEKADVHSLEETAHPPRASFELFSYFSTVVIVQKMSFFNYLHICSFWSCVMSVCLTLCSRIYSGIFNRYTAKSYIHIIRQKDLFCGITEESRMGMMT